jgi:flagellar biosynthesis component FlhA
MKKVKSRIGLLTILIIVVVIIWVASALLIIYGLDSWSDRGTFGDLFGAVNGLFSGLAFAGLIYTIVLQKKDLEMQRNEIQLNRDELKKSSRAQEKSEQALTEQVEQMKITSKLNALNTIINYYNLQISSSNHTEEIVQKFKEKRREAIKEIDVLINRVGDDELD